MRWTLAAIAFVAATIGLAAWFGRPDPLDVTIPEFGRRDDLDLDQIRGHLTALTSTPSRISGTAGAEAAAQYIEEQLRALGVDDLEIQEFPVAVPVVDHASLTVSDGTEIALHPLWPNLARTSQTPLDGITGPLIDVGGGTEPELAGKPISGAVVLMNWDSDSEWLNIQEFGGRAVIFRGDRPSSGAQARKKFISIPANVPRFYADPDAAAALEAQIGQPVTVKCRMDWQPTTGKNILARLTKGAPPPGAPDVDHAPVVFHAYYDSISVTPTRAPGAEQACGPAVLLELARYIKGLPEEPPRPLYLLFEGGHGQHLSGMTAFIRRLVDGLEKGWPPDERNSLTARMGRPGLFVGLDLSSRSERMGLFCVGAFRGQMEHLLRPRFSALALEIDRFAKSYMTNYEEVTPHTVTPFVDCVNSSLGRGWWTYFPYRAAFSSELATLAGIPGVTLSTINDERRYVDTPDDTLENLDFGLLRRQIQRAEGERAGLANLILAFAYWKGPFVSSSLENKMRRVEGRVVWLDSTSDLTPNRGLARAVAALKTYRGDKHLLGTRGLPVVLTDDNGAFTFDGLVDTTANPLFYTVEVEAYGLATRTFLEANPKAVNEYLTVMSRGGEAVTSIPEDGSVIFAVDQARPGEQPFSTFIMNLVQYVSPVAFPCKPVTLFGLTEPRGFLSLFDVEILDAATNSSPYQWGTSFSDSWRGDPEENCITMWADPSLRVRLTLGLGAQEKRLILINNTPEDPVGAGYVLSELDSIPSWVLAGARSMWLLNEDRIHRFEQHGIGNPRVESFHREAREYLEEAEAALERNDYTAYRTASERGWALETSAYSELLGMANNMIRGVLFYLLLLIPFSYCLERLVVNAGTIRSRIIGILVIFGVSFVLLAVIHPAFRFTLTPMLVLIAFIILALAVSVSALILSKFDRMLRDRKQSLTGTHEDARAVGSVAARAVDLGIANIRRRPQRAFFTAMTVILVTYTLLSFTSVVPEISISRLRHREGEPVYAGMLARDRRWQPMPLPLYDSLRRTYGTEEARERGIAVAGRAWYFSDTSGILSKIDVAPALPEDIGPETRTPVFVADALIGMEPAEARITGVAGTLVAGRWFQDRDELGIILPEHAADTLGLDADDIGTDILLFGQKLPLLGLIDGEKFDQLRDIDGEPLSPANFAQQQLLEATDPEEEPTATIREYAHWPVIQTAIVPFEVARSFGATVRSVAVRTGDGVDPDSEAAAHARRSNLTILASDGEAVTLYAAVNRNRLSAAGQIVVPLLLGFVMVLGTMLGSVYERHREIFVYNSVGLTPTNVASLFLAESSVYAVLGAAAGYLLGTVSSKLLLATGVLPSLSLNYSAGTTVFVTVLTMSIVLLSAVYPARLAFQAAVPRERKTYAGIEADEASEGDRIAFYLPFVSAPDNVVPMQAYLHEFLQSVEGVSVGELAVDDLEAAFERNGEDAEPVLRFRAWLAPFDLGISHEAELRVRYREDRGVHQYHISAVRVSGDQQNWRRLLPRFTQALRKQLLLWRILPADEQEAYRARGQALFRGCDGEGSA